MSLSTKEIEQNIVNVLVRLDVEAKTHDITEEEFGKRGAAISRVLHEVENDFGEQVMVKIFIDASKQAGHTIGPLDSLFLEKLFKLGFKIRGVGKIVSYQ